MTLAPAQLEAIATAVVQKLPDHWQAKSPVCNRAEAMAFARVTSERAWVRFCKRHKLKAMEGGMYSRTEVERAAERHVREMRGIYSR